ncbi:hypothetical protein B0H66DRAFT_563201 [Apodospora peruviana]|uniref:Uncharacterized protein n=1 Tax=Apodospora peruviana TaxID=516989 RepID=A0AAE0HXC2_9PEZI|nr:hypothetical protein B0H66DRAFT_563201 [Apodospora peruviana]
MDSLERGLDTADAHNLPLAAKLTIAKAFWGRPLLDTFGFAGKQSGSSEASSLDAYFRYYSQQCDLIALHDNGENSSLRTHQDIIRTAELLQQDWLGRTREDLLQRLPMLLNNKTEGQHGNTISLVARLLTMMRIGEVPHEFLGGRDIPWPVDTRLGKLVDDYFSATPVLGHEAIKFEKPFNALSLRSIAGLEIRWTDNLADHLRLLNDDSMVCVFHHAAFLQGQGDKSIFHPSFLEETLRTLALLLPKYDKKIKSWYSLQTSRHGLDPAGADVGHLIADERQIESFKYWHDRLVILKQVYDGSRPRTLSQWWHDRRNGVQWYTFWVAILVLFLTIFFGLIQSIEGALQVYKAFHPDP